ncbi:hypothetical protein BDM02DRAFT_3273044 [Thelephora ganbajun]|uniref:Uncharacterized protein n=1 Tax=Thelephora ganbajun TaxID=370292 RepID=A0ACB6Z1P2_THEGA|nr:hypothetical protein BDM02DRAFT_3273044 [Thelephora ganbajun]
MSASPPYLTTIPIDILEQILLRLPTQDIIKVESINRYFRDLVRDLPTLQHRRELFAIGLIDNPYRPCDLTERRKQCKGYMHKWTNATSVMRSTYELLPTRSSSWGAAKYSGNGLLVSSSLRHKRLAFLHVPPVASRKSVESWTIPPLPFRIMCYAVYPPENVIAVAESKENLICIHFLSLQDGSPFYVLPSNTIVWELPPSANLIGGYEIAITASRIMMHFPYRSEGPLSDGDVWRIVVWDRKTRNVVLDLLSTDESELVKRYPQVVFLDEFRMVVIPDKFWSLELVVFDTLIPQNHPGNVQRLELPPRFYDQLANIRVDHDRDLGILSTDEALIADPSQAVLVIELLGGNFEPTVLVVVRMQVLIERKYPVRADSRVSWDEWGRHIVAREVLVNSARILTFVHGSQVMVVQKFFPGSWSLRGHQPHCVRTFDFSRRGFLPLRDGADRTEKRVVFEHGADFRFEPDEGMELWDRLHSLSDGSFFHLGTPSDGHGLDNTLQLQLWEPV